MRHFVNIYRNFTAVALVLGCSATAFGQATNLTKQVATVEDAVIWGMPVNHVLLKRNADLMTMGMNLVLGDYTQSGDKVSVFTPVLKNGNDSVECQPVALYSRIRYIQYLRDGNEPVGGADEVSMRYSRRPEAIEVNQSVPYEDWMNGATLYLRRDIYGCCHSLLDEELVPLGRWRQESYVPKFVYVTPVAEGEKLRELSGRAYIDFPVNMTNLYPDYRNNPAELAKIIATIDSVRNDKDVTVRVITIKGWASPESPWENNTRLAKGRTATLKQYVQNLYNFPEGLIQTDYYPEDWFGLREFVEKSNLPHRDEILALIDDDSIEPDPKEAKLKATYPEEYKFLLATVYPGLRHSDYKIEYVIRQFSDPAEIRRVMATEPQKLSLEEMFLLAQTLKPGSDEYNDVFETAVRMYPDNATANLNAANSAMQRNDLVKAWQYLDKAGDSAQAEYARGVLSAIQGDYTKATQYIEKAQALGLDDATGVLKEIKEFTEF